LAKIFHPSNLKSNNRQKTNHQDQRPERSPNSTVQTTAQATIHTTVQATVAQPTPPSREESVIFADSVKEDSASDTVTLNQSLSNNHDPDIESADEAYTQLSGASNYARQASNPPNSFGGQPLDLKPISTAPKINLPQSELEYFDTAPMESSRELAEAMDITTNQTSLTTAVQHSALQLSTTKQSLTVPVKNKKFSQLIPQYQVLLAQVLTSQKLRHQPLINRCQAQMAQYKYKLLPLLKQWQKKGWLTNAGLALLSLITVIIISQMFF
jgi:hypothetical protein